MTRPKPKSTGHQVPVAGLFEEIRAAFPALRMDLRYDHLEVDLLMDVPQQRGLDFAVSLNLQGDELHLSAGAFWVQWFPCTDVGVRNAFRDAVIGLLSGRYRIVEHCLGRHALKAELQHPVSGGWQTLATWSSLGSWLPWPRRIRVRQNHPHQ